MSLIGNFGKVYTFKRYAKPTMTNGKVDSLVEVLNAGQPWTMLASIQNLKPTEILVLPEGERNREWIKIYTDVLLQVADEKTGQVPDRIFYRNKWYQIRPEADWTDNDLPFYKFLAVREP